MYRKFKADKIFTGVEILSGNQVLITDDTGVIIDIIPADSAGDNVESYMGLLTPGFINCHCHLELSHMKGLIPKHTGLVDFVFKIVNERHFEEAEILAAIEAGEHEMLQNGIVAVGDICNNDLTLKQKLKRNLYYHNFIEASGFPPAIAKTRFERSLNFYNAYAAVLPANSIVPHAPYSVSPELFQMINEFPGNNILTIHNQEIPDENELFKKKQGDFLRMYEKMGIDISFLKQVGNQVCRHGFHILRKGNPLFSYTMLLLLKKILNSPNIKHQTSNLKHISVFVRMPIYTLVIHYLMYIHSLSMIAILFWVLIAWLQMISLVYWRK